MSLTQIRILIFWWSELFEGLLLHLVESKGKYVTVDDRNKRGFDSARPDNFETILLVYSASSKSKVSNSTPFTTRLIE